MSATILLISTLLQFAAAVLALRLVFITGRWRAWSLIAIALILMGIRRSITFYRVVIGDVSPPPDLTAELVALLISILMVSGVLLMGPLFNSIHRTQDELSKSEKRFRDVVEVAGDWIWEMDSDLRFTFLSPRFFELFPFESNNVIGKTRIDFTGAGHDSDSWHEHFDDLKNRKPFRDFEYSVTAPDDRVRHLRISGKPIFDTDDHFLGYRGTGTDITMRKQAEEARQQTESRFQAIIDNSPSPIYFKDLDCRFIIVNMEYEKVYGVRIEDIRGKTSRAIFDDKGFEFTSKHDQEVLSTRRVIAKEESLIDRDFLATKFPIVNAQGELLGLGGIDTDISEFKRVEKTITRALVEAQQANHAKSEFLAHMSHELRTPLNSIIGFSQTMIEEVFGKIGNDKYAEYIDDIQKSGYHLLQLINDILDISKIEAGELAIEESDIDLDKLLNSCHRMIQGEKMEKSVSVQYNSSENLPHIWADERYVKQIVLNLLSNAVKYNIADGTVRLSTGVDQNNSVFIAISDTGVGIAAEDIPMILEPFGQARTGAHLAHEGTGLGLSLSKKLVELHGGTLEIESEIGNGTMVTVKFPSERTYTA